MTISPRAIEAAARACYEHEPLERDDFIEITWDELGQGTRDRFMHKARKTLTAYLAVDEASSLRHFVMSHLDNQDMNHADFRVHAYQIAAASTGDSPRKTEVE